MIGNNEEETSRALLYSIALSIVFLSLETIIGFLTGSLVLLSDALHMIGDIGALSVTLAAHKLQISSKRSGESGLMFELGGALINGCVLLLASLIIILEGIKRLSTETLPVFGWPIAFMGLAGLVVNIVAYTLISKSKSDSVNIIGAIAHLRVDALGSIGAIVASVFVMVGYPVADIFVAIFMSGFTTYSGITVLLSTFKKIKKNRRDLPGRHYSL